MDKGENYNNKNIEIWATNEEFYKLLDSGNGCKLEEVAGVRIARSEPRAWWKCNLDAEEWKKALASFYIAKQGKPLDVAPLDFTRGKHGKWVFKQDISKDLVLDIEGVKAKIKFAGGSKHIGIFPEQYSEWKWMSEKIKGEVKSGRDVKVLNLFGYTGMASLFAAKAGAKVTHVDASEASINWAKENQKLSGLEELPIRWITDDAIKFLKREIKRGERYDAIVMDPPSYGRGPKGEVWKIEENIEELMSLTRQALPDSPLFVIINMYSTELSSVSVSNLLRDMMKGKGGSVRAGELALVEEDSKRLLPMSIFAVWES